jgi:hypothetical protein
LEVVAVQVARVALLPQDLLDLVEQYLQLEVLVVALVQLVQLVQFQELELDMELL